MKNIEKIFEPEIKSRLTTYEGWTYEGGFLVRHYVFADFVEAFSFLTKVALISESLGHHPDWSGVYNKVTLRLRTHDADGISELDFQFLARLS